MALSLQLGPARLALAEEPARRGASVGPARYVVRSAAVHAPAARDSVDGRFRLRSRFEQPPDEPQRGSGIELRAKLELVGAALCATGGAPLFSDGFESP